MEDGALSTIFEAVNRIASKYQKEYDEISQKIISIGAPKYKTFIEGVHYFIE